MVKIVQQGDRVLLPWVCLWGVLTPIIHQPTLYKLLARAGSGNELNSFFRCFRAGVTMAMKYASRSFRSGALPWT